jgi:hypothetical protein
VSHKQAPGAAGPGASQKGARGAKSPKAAAPGSEVSPSRQLTERRRAVSAGRNMIWLVLALIVLGGIVGAALALK